MRGGLFHGVQTSKDVVDGTGYDSQFGIGYVGIVFHPHAHRVRFAAARLSVGKDGGVVAVKTTVHHVLDVALFPHVVLLKEFGQDMVEREATAMAYFDFSGARFGGQGRGGFGRGRGGGGGGLGRVGRDDTRLQARNARFGDFTGNQRSDPHTNTDGDFRRTVDRWSVGF